MSSFFQIGVDGGGTKTECILVDAGGEIVARHTAPGCNPNVIGPDQARAVLADALRALTSSGPGPIVAGLLCMSGNRAFWREVAAGLTGLGRVVAVDDSHPVLELATDGAPGLVLHAGTGSFVAARAPDGTVHYAGGIGWRFGDPGSGYDLGRRAIAQALLELQGWKTVGRSLATDGASSPASGLPTPESPLVTALQEHVGVSEYNALSRRLYQDPEANAKIAGFAPRLLALAEQGDVPAQRVVAESLTELAGVVDRVLVQLFPAAKTAGPTPAIPAGVSGAILNSPPAVFALRALAETRGWPVAFRFITAPPIEGVRRMLLRLG